MSAARDVAMAPIPGATPVGPNEYIILAPNGKHLRASKELFDAIVLMKELNAGSVEVQFKNGGICGVEVHYKLK